MTDCRCEIPPLRARLRREAPHAASSTTAGDAYLSWRHHQPPLRGFRRANEGIKDGIRHSKQAFPRPYAPALPRFASPRRSVLLVHPQRYSHQPARVRRLHIQSHPCRVRSGPHGDPVPSKHDVGVAERLCRSVCVIRSMRCKQVNGASLRGAPPALNSRDNNDVHTAQRRSLVPEPTSEKSQVLPTCHTCDSIVSKLFSAALGHRKCPP